MTSTPSTPSTPSPPARPRVVVIFTGGTISMAADPVAGGNVPTLDGAAILARTPGLEEIAEVVAVDRGRTPASHFTFEALFDLADLLRSTLAEPEVAGAVVVQGTDTIEETAFFWDLLLAGAKPVVVTGAMRASDAPGFDGPANLRDAVRAAASPRLRDQGVVVSLAGTIEPADDVTKTHASALDTFRSPNGGSLGRVEGDRVVIFRRRAARRYLETDRAAGRVHLITAHLAMDGTLLDAAVAAGADGIVVAATGAGNTSAELLAAARRAMAAGIPVALATRTPGGAASTAYAFPGGGGTWIRAGAILAGHLGPAKARIALALGVGAGLDHDALAGLLADPIDAADAVDAVDAVDGDRR